MSSLLLELLVNRAFEGNHDPFVTDVHSLSPLLRPATPLLPVHPSLDETLEALEAFPTFLGLILENAVIGDVGQMSDILRADSTPPGTRGPSLTLNPAQELLLVLVPANLLPQFLAARHHLLYYLFII